MAQGDSKAGTDGFLMRFPIHSLLDLASSIKEIAFLDSFKEN